MEIGTGEDAAGAPVPTRHNRNLAELYADSQVRLKFHANAGTAAIPTGAGGGGGALAVDVGGGGGGGGREVLAQRGGPAAATTAAPAVPGEDVVWGARELLGSSFRWYPPAAPALGGGGGTLAAESLEKRLNRHENEVLREISDRARERTRSRLEAKVESLLQSAWERDRDAWIQELIGDRRLGGAASSPYYPGGPAEEPGRPLLQLIGDEAPDRTRRAAAGHLPPDANSAISEHATLVKLHLTPQVENERALTVENPIRVSSAAQRAIDAFLDLAGSHPSSPGMAAVNSPGYRAAWQLLASVASLSSRRPSPVDLARAALGHLGAQFFALMAERLRSTAASADRPQRQQLPRYTNATASAAAQYVKVALGLDGMAQEEGLWATLYYCLRCGNPMAAQNVLGASGSHRLGIDAAVVRLIESYAASRDENLWTGEAWRYVSGRDGSFRALSLDQDDLEIVRDLQMRISSGGTSNQNQNLFQLGVYALLTGAPLPSDDSTPGFCNIEDYLFSRLWEALIIPLSDQTQSPERGLKQLGRSIRDLESEYFGTRDPYSFAWPLLATQQHATALEHLVSAGGLVGLLQATHLGLVMTNLLGIGLADLRDDNDPNDHSGSAGSSQELMTRLLVQYAHAVVPLVGAAPALEYAVRIPSVTRATLEVARMVASSTTDLSELAGTINEQGVREGGSEGLNAFGLDVPRVLSEAAELMLRASNVTRESKGRAAMCYMLAGQYGNVLQLLSHCISPPEQIDDGDREYWIRQANDFRAHYLVAQTRVFRVLERESPAVMETMYTLLGLNQYYGKVSGGRRDEACEILSHLNLLPTSRTDIATKEAAYRAHDPLVQNAIPALLTAAVSNLFQEYQTLHGSLAFPGGDLVRTRIEQVRAQAKLYVAFAGTIGMGGDRMQAISRMDALMS